jgi:spermidine synthase
MTALGRHIIAELYNCHADRINDVSFVEKTMLEAADKAGATVINSTFHHFSPFGVSGVIVIQESHFSIHCWPEYGYASMDIYTCGDTVDPWVAYEYLKFGFNASHGSTMELNRGQTHLLRDGLTYSGRKHPLKTGKIQHSRNIWFTEKNENIALSLRHTGERLFLHQSDFQKIEIFQTEAFGKILVLDGKIVCAEEDEYVYHEMIAHVPAFAHPSPGNVLVIGGGDGGTVRELVKHDIIDSIDLVEIDENVIKASEKFLPQIASSYQHSKVSIHIEDGIEFVKKVKPNTYDLVIIDSDEPEGPGKGLFTNEFYEDVYKILSSKGALITQSESPRYNVEVFKGVYDMYQQLFGIKNVHCYLMYLPSFPSGMWSFSYSSKGAIDPLPKSNRSVIDAFCIKNDLKYYSFDIHNASFVLPQFVKDILK